MTNATQTNATQYIDLHVFGYGKLYRVRKVAPQKGQPFWACSIRAVDAATNSSIVIDMRVSGPSAIAQIVELQDKANNSDVFVKFAASDLFWNKWSVDGQSKSALKGRLLKFDVVDAVPEDAQITMIGAGYVGAIIKVNDDRFAVLNFMHGEIGNGKKLEYVRSYIAIDEHQAALLRKPSKDDKVVACLSVNLSAITFWEKTKGEQAGEQIEQLSGHADTIYSVKVNGQQTYN